MRGLLLALVVLAGCDGGDAGSARSVLLVTFDTVRRDAVGFLGASPSPTPVLDAIAREAVVFEDAYAVSPLTLPAHTSLLTGLYPTGHGLRDNGIGRLPDAAETLAEVLKRRGYGTGASVSAFVLDGCFGLAQGFDTYHAPARPLAGGDAHYAQWRADEGVDRAIADVRRLAAAGAPFFYWLHCYDPHAPYDAPGAPAGDYAAEIRFADAQFGRLVDELKALDVWDELVVLFASDHGEGLLDGLERTHGTFVDDAEMRIPLFLRHPDVEPGRVAVQMSQVDALPTLLELLGLPFSAERFDGVSLARLLRGETDGLPARALAIECYRPFVSYGWSPFEGLVQGPWKYVRSRRKELFDRAADPGEDHNLYDPTDTRSLDLERRSDAHFRNAVPRFARESVELSARDRDALTGLGYADTGSSSALEVELDFDNLPDTYGKRAVLDRFLDLQTRVVAGSAADPVGEMRALLALDPHNPDFLVQLAKILLEESHERVTEAEPLVLRARALRPGSTEVHWVLGFCHTIHAEREFLRMKTLVESGRRDDADRVRVEWVRRKNAAQAELRTVLQLEPTHPGARSNLALALKSDADFLARTGRAADARPLYREVVSLLKPLLGQMPPDHPERGFIKELADKARARL